MYSTHLRRGGTVQHLTAIVAYVILSTRSQQSNFYSNPLKPVSFDRVIV